MKSTRKILAGLLAATTILSVMPIAGAAYQAFVDVPRTHWAYDSIQYGHEHDYIKGVGNQKYAPEDILTYNQFAVLIDRICFDGDSNPEVKNNKMDWYIPYCADLRARHVLEKVVNYGDHGVPRCAIAQIMYQAMAALGADTTVGAYTKTSDWQDIPESYQNAVGWCFSRDTPTGHFVLTAI